MRTTRWSPAFRARLREHLKAFAGPDDARGARELGLTGLAYAALLATTSALIERVGAATSHGGRLGWGVLTVVSAGTLSLVMVRSFLLHHDLCHHSLFRSRRVNRALAPFVGVLASTSSSVWRREHERHHRDSNNLDRPQDGQTGPWTVEQYRAARPLVRSIYWLLNQRPVLFGLVPPLYFIGFMHVAARWYENVLFAAFLVLLHATGTLGAFALAFVPATLFGFLLFHAQHTGPALVRRRTADYDVIENGLVGSTLLTTPRVPLVSYVLDWCLYGVELHHVHHLHPGIPAWRQRACHDAAGDLFDDVPRITLLGAARATSLTLYDEEAGRLVTFAEARRPR